MPHKKPAVLIVGHGTISGNHEVIDIGNYNLIVPVKIGNILSVVSHNLILSNLMYTSSSDQLFYELEKLENLPSTTSVNKSNTSTLSIEEKTIGYQDIKDIELLLTKFKDNATSSSKSWIMFEHKIAPALDVLNSDDALTPNQYKNYSEFHLMHSGFIPGTLIVCVNIEKIKNQLLSLTEKMNKKAISEDQLIYVTPIAKAGYDIKLSLSELFNTIKNIHILALKVTKSFTIEEKKETEEIIEIAAIAMENIVDNVFSACTEKVNSTGESVVSYYDFYIPDDSNIVLGSCRDIDESF
jgi:hypothetical protein